MRKLIKDILTPVIQQQTTDMDANQQLRKSNEAVEERVKAIEGMVFKDASVSTVLDDMRERIEAGEASLMKVIAEVSDKNDNRQKAFEEKIFEYDQRINTFVQLKEQFENFRMKQQAFEHSFLSYKDKVTEQFTALKE